MMPLTLFISPLCNVTAGTCLSGFMFDVEWKSLQQYQLNFLFQKMTSMYIDPIKACKGYSTVNWTFHFQIQVLQRVNFQTFMMAIISCKCSSCTCKKVSLTIIKVHLTFPWNDFCCHQYSNLQVTDVYLGMITTNKKGKANIPLMFWQY